MSDSTRVASSRGDCWASRVNHYHCEDLIIKIYIKNKILHVLQKFDKLFLVLMIYRLRQAPIKKGRRNHRGKSQKTQHRKADWEE